MAETTGTTKTTARKTTTARKSGTTRSAASRSTSRSTTGRTTASRSTGTARKTTATKRNTTTKQNAAKSNARATSRNASRATARTQTKAAREAAQARKEAVTVVERVGDVAERTVLTGVGITLSARDGVVEVLGTYTDRKKLEKQLKGFERRGTTARNRFEREVKKTRTRVERELRQRTNRVEKDVKALRTDAARLGKDLEKTAVAQQVELAQAVAGNVASGAVLGASKAARQVTGRVAAVVA